LFGIKTVHKKAVLCVQKAFRARCITGMVYSYPDIVDSAGKIIPYQSPSTFPQGRVFRDFLRKNRITTFSATLIRRAVFDRVGLLDERPEATTCDDYDLWLRISELYDIKFDESREVLYRVHDTNLVKKLELNLSAHLFVFNKTLRASPGVRSISEKERRQIIDGHLRDKYLWFAEKYLYDNKDSAKARRLYVKALMIKPWDINALWHLLICVVPRRIKAWLKKSVLKNVFLKRSIFTKG
jgi:hypothetical protein